LPDGGFIDHGSRWVTAGQSRIEALAADLGVALFPTWDDGTTVGKHDPPRPAAVVCPCGHNAPTLAAPAITSQVSRNQNRQRKT